MSRNDDKDKNTNNIVFLLFSFNSTITIINWNINIYNVNDFKKNIKIKYINNNISINDIYIYLRLQVHSIYSTHLIFKYSHFDINGNAKIFICDINSNNWYHYK